MASKPLLIAVATALGLAFLAFAGCDDSGDQAAPAGAASPAGAVSPAGPAPSVSPAASATTVAPATATPTVAQPTATATAALPANAPACPKDGYSITGSARSQGGAVVISLQIKSAGEPCTVTQPLVVGMFDRSAQPLLGMAANPASLATGFVIGTDATAKTVTWSNWCAAPGTFSANVALGGKTAVVPIGGPPNCTAPSQKSAVTLAP